MSAHISAIFKDAIDPLDLTVTAQGAMTLEWEPYRKVLEELYLTSDRPLHEVMTIMKDQHRFNAT